MIRLVLTSALILVSGLNTSFVQAKGTYKSDGFYSLGVFSSPQSKRTGVELSGMIHLPQGDFVHGLKVSALLYQARYQEADAADNFVGFSAAWHIYAAGDASPYIGLGVFSGENLKCTRGSDWFNDDEYYASSYRYYCDGDYLLAIYPEVGVTLKTKHLQISPFVRRYFDTHGSDTPSNTYGISIGIRF